MSSLPLRYPLAAGAPPLPRLTSREVKLLGRLADRIHCGKLLEIELVRMPGLGDFFSAFCAPIKAVGSLSGPVGSHLTTLILDGNSIGDAGAIALAEAAKEGGLRSLVKLSLGNNGIGTRGLNALTGVSIEIPNALAQLADLNLWDNELGSAGCTALAQELARGAFNSLRSLYLGANDIGTEGCKSLADCFLKDEDGDGKGALPNLERLHLYRNNIERQGAIAIGKSLHQWGLRFIKEIVLDGNNIDARAIKFVEDALQRRVWGRIMIRQWRMHISDDAHRLLDQYGGRAADRRSAMSGVAQLYVHSKVDVI